MPTARPLLKLALVLAASLPVAPGLAGAATLANRYSFSAVDDPSDSVGGNDGIAINGAYVDPAEGGLVLPGTGTGLGAASMVFTDLIDIGFTYGDSGVTIETWYTDDGTGTWGKLFHFGTNAAGLEIAFTNFRGGDNVAPGLDRNGAIPLLDFPFGSNTRPALGEEHHLVVAIDGDGTTSLWLDGAKQIDALPTNDLINVGVEVEAIGATSWADPGHRGAVNEFRIWEGALTGLEAGANFLVGPDEFPSAEDTDADGLLDAWEEKWFGEGNLSQGAGDNPDMDGLTNLEEFNANPALNPDDADSDDDGLSDGDEIKVHFTLPLDPDTDNDTLSDGDEVNVYMTEPLFTDSDLDFYSDAQEIANGTDPNNPNDPPPFGMAELVHRYSYSEGAELSDAVSGNSAVLHGTAEVFDGMLQLDGFGSGADASSMRFTTPVDFGGNFGGTGASIETWFTDSGTGTWGKLFTFGTNAAGQEIAWTNYRGDPDVAPGLDRNGAVGIESIPFGSGDRLSLDEEHHLALTINPDGTTNLWIDGTQEIFDHSTNPLSNVVTSTESIGSTAWNDPGHYGTVNEFRIYKGELTGEQILTNFTEGPDAGGGVGGGEPFSITQVSRDPATGVVTLTWPTVVDRRYAVYVSDEMSSGAPPTGWSEVFDGTATADSMSYDDTPPAGSIRRYYRVGDVTPP